jgi:general stress protein YciG
MQARKPNNSDETAEITVRQAGRRGGTRTLERHGREHFQAIGRKGGNRTAELYRDLLSEFGKRGGRPRRPTLDEYMGEEAGKKKEALRSVHPASPPPTIVLDKEVLSKLDSSVVGDPSPR